MGHASVGGRLKSKNAVVAKLEAGNAKLGGMRLLLPIDDRCLAPVEVIGITFGSSYRNGMLLKVVPVGGDGELRIDPADLIDDTPKSRSLYLRKSAAMDAADGFRREADSDRKRRDWILRRREAMSPTQRKRFDSAAQDHFGEGVDMVKGITKASGEWDLKRIAERCIKVSFDLDIGDTNGDTDLE